MSNPKPRPPLSRQTVEDLARSGITLADAVKIGIEELTADEAKRRFGHWSSGYLIPYRKGFGRLRFHKPVLVRGSRKPRKYTQPANTAPEIYFSNIRDTNWPQVVKDVATDLFIVEGEKKSSALAKAGYVSIGLGGVWAFRTSEGPLAQLDLINWINRKVCIIYDSDIVGKPSVQHAERELAAELIRRGAIVKRIRLPQATDVDGKTGVDDFLVSHGFPRKIAAARRAFDALPREEISLSNSGEHRSEAGNAKRFVRLYGAGLRYVTSRKQWYVLGPNGLWRPDEDGEVMRRVKATIASLYEDAARETDEGRREAAAKWALACERLQHLLAVVALAETEDGIAIYADDLDADPWILATQDGSILDLRGSSQRSAIPEDYVTKSLKFEFDPNAKCPIWDKFLLQIMGGDAEMVGFLQRAVGYSLTGDTSEQCVFFLWGQGANGKSTFLDTILELMGQYGLQASPETFMVRQGGNEIRADVVRLKGIRFIATSETEEGQRLAESMVKQWTGGEQIIAREPYGKPTQFSPIGKIWLATNHKPRISGTDYAIWRRVRLIPFTETFPPSRQDPSLKAKLRKELPGILNWALRGVQDWNQGGLRSPNLVAMATDEYRLQMDPIGAWIDERCITTPEARQLSNELFFDYQNFCSDTGERWVPNLREFNRKLEDKGLTKAKTTSRGTGETVKGLFIQGIKLKPRKPAGNPPRQNR